MKKLLLFLMLIVLPLTACSITVPNLDGTNNEDGKTVIPDDNTQNENNPNDGNNQEGTQNNPTGGNNNQDENQNNPNDGNGEDGENNPSDDLSEISISSPVFETRTLVSQDDVTSDDFFNLGNRVEIYVTISNEELNKLQDDYETGYKSEIYRLAKKVEIKLINGGNTFTWEFENVGIRQKGNTSRKNIINDDGTMTKNHYKLSFDETFDDPDMYDSAFISKYGNSSYSSRDFLGMSGLDFKWDKNEDATHIREVYANYLYRACGIMVQYSGLSTFKIKNSDTGYEKSMGLCTVYQPSSKSMIKDNLKDGVNYINMSDWDTEKAGTYGVVGAKYGDLYKCSWGTKNNAPTLTNVSGNVGVGNISGSYIPLYDRKTNKDADYDDNQLINVSNAIKSGKYDEISKYVDIQYLAMCEAVGFVVGNPDSMRYNSNNYMVYIRRTDGKMIFIPIDNDRCFGITKDWNPRNANMTLDMLERKNSNGSNTIDLLLNTILSKTDNEAKTLYIKYCNMIKESEWVLEETFNTYYNMAKKSYSDYNFSLDRVNDNETFKTYINNKLNYITESDSNDSNNNTGNNNQGSTPITTDIYLVGTVNNWGDYSRNELSKWQLTNSGDNIYTITFTVNKLESDGNYVKVKFNGGRQDYSKLDWSISSDLSSLIKEPGAKSAKIYDVHVGDIITITINTSTLVVEVSVN